MTPTELRRIVATLPSSCPIADEFECEWRTTLDHEPWWRDQRQHLLGWLSDYDGPGAYDRQGRRLDAKHVYTHFQCASGLIWLAGALGEDAQAVRRAAEDARSEATQGHRPAAQCRAVRSVIPWVRIEHLLDQNRQDAHVSLRHFAAKLRHGYRNEG